VNVYVIDCSQLSKTCNYNVLFGSSIQDRRAGHISADVQTKLFMTVKHLSYKERLERLKLNIEDTRGDMIEVYKYKVLINKYYNNVTYLERQHNQDTV